MSELMNPEVVLMAKKGDPQAIQQLVENFRKPLFHYACNHLGNEFEAEDLTQEVLFKAIRALPGFKGESTIGTWIFRIMVNACIDYHRKQNGHKVISIHKSFGEEESANLELKDDRPLPDEIIEQNELSNSVKEALTKLSTEHRMIVILHDINGFKYQEIAAITKTSIGTVKSRLFYARQELRKLLLPIIKE